MDKWVERDARHLHFLYKFECIAEWSAKIDFTIFWLTKIAQTKENMANTVFDYKLYQI